MPATKKQSMVRDCCSGMPKGMVSNPGPFWLGAPFLHNKINMTRVVLNIIYMNLCHREYGEPVRLGPEYMTKRHILRDLHTKKIVSFINALNS